MPRRWAEQQMTLNDLEWLFHASRAISAVAELLDIPDRGYRFPSQAPISIAAPL